MADLTIATVTTAAQVRTPLLVLPGFEDGTQLTDSAAELDAMYAGALSRVLARGDFSGRKDEFLLLHAPDADAGTERVLLVGLGKRAEYGPERLRRAVGTAIRQAERLRIGEPAFALWHESAGLDADATASIAAEAAVVAAWDYRDLKTVVDPARAPLLTGIQFVARDDAEAERLDRAAQRGRIIGRAVNLARSLAVRPGNVATPEFLADTARDLAKRFGMDITVLDRAALAREGLKALLAVAQGSDEEPRFIVLEYRRAGPDVRPLVLVGKGVTFDSGGISIKPAERMEDMKYDMSGAAAVLGAMQGIAELELRANVIALIPSTENLPSGRALKPGDVIGSHLGKTIEVVNTDAEGRLVLADALSWAQRYEPAAVLDAATLTGAVVVALGQHAIGLMGSDDALIDEVRAVGERTGERCWPLPLWPPFREQIDSVFADIKNSGGRQGGSITAGWFLREFAGSAPWAHLDIAGTAYKDEAAPYLRKGPTGIPTRIFIEWVRSRAHA
jgi:leucyl aminopeptidase